MVSYHLLLATEVLHRNGCGLTGVVLGVSSVAGQVFKDKGWLCQQVQVWSPRERGFR